MNTDLPVRERALPPETAARIRSAILVDEPETADRRPNRWLLGLAAALVVIALLATAVVLWPRTGRTQVVQQPTVTPTSSGSASPTPGPDPTGVPSPTPAPSRTGPLEPGPNKAPFDTDRGPLTDRRVAAMIGECESFDGIDYGEVPYARRVTDGEKTEDVVIYRRNNGEQWFCAPDSLYVPLDAFNPEIGPNASFPVVTDSGQGSGMDQNGATSVWIFRALSSVRRIQVRAVVDGSPKRWFEADVRGGFAYVPVYTSGTFEWDEAASGPAGLTYQQRAFDKKGREVPVRVMEMPR